MSGSLKGLLIRHEGYRHDPYDDATGASIVNGYTLKGHATIGIGTKLSESRLSDRAINFLYDEKIAEIGRFFDQHIGWWKDLTSARQQVLFSVAYNTGCNGLLGFKKMLNALEGYHYDRAADELLDSKAARHLLSRYEELAGMLRTG